MIEFHFYYLTFWHKFNLKSYIQKLNEQNKIIKMLFFFRDRF